MKPLHLIVAMSPSRAIGRAGKIPWHIQEDLKRFKALTMGHAIVMGRKTFESIGRVPGRRNIVVTRGWARPAGDSPQWLDVCDSVESAINFAQSIDSAPFICGGADIYAAALPRCTHFHITNVHAEVEGADTFFPGLDNMAIGDHLVEVHNGYTFADFAREGWRES